MSSNSYKTMLKRPKNPTIQNFLPISNCQVINSDKMGQPQQQMLMSDLLNNNKTSFRTSTTPRVSIKTTSQLCLNQDARPFPYMEVGKLEVEESVFRKLKMDTNLLEIPDGCKDQRFSVLSYEQVNRLSELMNEVVPIHGRGNFPTLEVKLCDLVSLVRSKLELDNINVKEIRLNGSGASTVLASDSCNISYNDLDLIFTLELPTQKHYERVKQAVLDSLLDLLPEGTSKKRMSSCTLKEAYVSKMVKVNDSDRWSLIALGNNKTHSVELKFVDRMKRKYEFSVDSFHIMLDTLFLFYNCARMNITDNFYPTVVGESVYGNFNDALVHLHKKLIATKSPEEIRGGGLLKYCNLLVKNYRPAWPEQVKTMERYMCSRFFIDFPDLTGQHNKLCKFLDNHFQVADSQLKYDYLMILYQVVDESTVCLMGHERRQTLDMILELAGQVYQPDYCCDQSQIPGSGYCTPGQDTGAGSWSSASSTTSGQTWASSCNNSSVGQGSNSGWGATGSSSSSSSSGQYSPMSTSSTCSPSLSPKPAEHVSPDTCHNAGHVSASTILPHKFTVPPPAVHPVGPPPPCPPVTTSYHPAPPPPCPPPPTITVHNTTLPPPAAQYCTSVNQTIPTYEIVTSCQPSVIYSNGYYYTSFTPPTPTPPSTAPCYTCSCSCGAPPPPPGPAHWTVTAPPPPQPQPGS